MSGDLPRVVVVGLGPGHPDSLTVAARTAIDATPVRFVRTRRHPSAHLVDPAGSFDDVYQGADELEDVYRTIVGRLATAAAGHGTVLYAVPGSPVVAERTVELLRGRHDLVVDILPAVSFLDLAWARLGVDPVAAGVRVVDGQAFGTEAAGQTGPLLVAQCDSTAVLSAIKLAVDQGPEVTVLQRLGLPDEAVTTVAWADLDRSVTADHLTCLWIPALAEPVAGEVAGLDAVVRTLREQCPWDREQTHASLARHLLEETYEVLEAIDELGTSDPEAAEDGWEHLEEELGDLLLQVVFHATLAAEAGRFTLADVARGITDKMVRRHPHVFADVVAADVEAVAANWETLKQAEKGRASVLDGIPTQLPALAWTAKLQRRAGQSGLGAGLLPGEGEAAAAAERALAAAVGRSGADGAPMDERMGDLLFAVADLARRADVDPESALRTTSAAFRRRVTAVEAADPR